MRLGCAKDSRAQYLRAAGLSPSDCPRCGPTLDAGLAQISAGLAWCYRYYASGQSAEDRERYESEEDEARLRKRGLWAHHSPVLLWEWRQRVSGR